MKNIFSRIANAIRTFSHDSLDEIIAWEITPEGRMELKEETYAKAAKLGYSRAQIEDEALERSGYIW